MQNLVNLLDIKTTSSNISSNKNRVASGSEALKGAMARLLSHLGVQG
jgi:hypothetical protein